MATHEASGGGGGAQAPLPAFVWNAGGWFGAQIGSTLWMLILGAAVLRRDALGGLICLGGWGALNAWGVYLWGRREGLGPHAGFQLFLGAASLVFAAVVLALRARGLSEAPSPGSTFSTYLPLWILVLAPGLMLLFYLRERSARRG